VTCGCEHKVFKRYAPFVLDLGVFGKLEYDGRGLRLSRTGAVPDGVYGVLETKDGAPVSLGPAPAFVYVPPDCAPSPAPCPDGAGGEWPGLDPSASNLASLTAGGILVRLEVQSSDTVALTGGTPGAPLRAEVLGGSGGGASTIISATPDVLEVSGGGTSYQLTHKAPAGSGTVSAGLEIDAYGHVKSFQGPDTPGIMTVVPVQGGAVDVLAQGGAVVLDLTKYFAAPFEVDTDAGRASFDIYGRMSAMGAPVPVADVFHYMGTADLAALSLTFTAVRVGRVSGTLRGDLKRDAVRGLTAVSGVALDGVAVPAYLEGDQAGKAVALHFASPGVGVGDHDLVFTLSPGGTTVVVLEARLCL
jgi:hypothetical protein